MLTSLIALFHASKTALKALSNRARRRHAAAGGAAQPAGGAVGVSVVPPADGRDDGGGRGPARPWLKPAPRGEGRGNIPVAGPKRAREEGIFPL
eukprot:2015074-Pyramimonas_sp.AAC.2